MKTLLKETLRSIIFQLLLIGIGLITISIAYDMVYERYHDSQSAYQSNFARCAGRYEWIFEGGCERMKASG